MYIKLAEGRGSPWALPETCISGIAERVAMQSTSDRETKQRIKLFHDKFLSRQRRQVLVQSLDKSSWVLVLINKQVDKPLSLGSQSAGSLVLGVNQICLRNYIFTHL